MEDCIFCKIVKGEIPSYKVYEDENFLGFLDIKPVSKGHLLVIPKEHFRWVWEIEDFTGLWSAVKKITLGVLKGLSAEKVHYVTVGEAVPHAHVHVVPRYKDDGMGELPDWSKGLEFSDEEKRQMSDSIKENI